ncbi:hypothetical protein HAX54_024050 [Datura stramonium]|uniref:Uncharacterized protein n=1 Tax=Datura stramonium TaxID=4076 RepID=A0ABS8Y5L8_DATST|nr:hypothetical protein [Datura stramonium]
MVTGWNNDYMRPVENRPVAIRDEERSGGRDGGLLRRIHAELSLIGVAAWCGGRWWSFATDARRKLWRLEKNEGGARGGDRVVAGSSFDGAVEMVGFRLWFAGEKKGRRRGEKIRRRRELGADLSSGRWQLWSEINEGHVASVNGVVTTVVRR